jgi:hypothetical protein
VQLCNTTIQAEQFPCTQNGNTTARKHNKFEGTSHAQRHKHIDNTYTLSLQSIQAEQFLGTQNGKTAARIESELAEANVLCAQLRSDLDDKVSGATI